jgi:hypothetical protein
MDPMTILSLVEKGITVVSMLVAAGQNAAPAITALKELVTGARKGSVTDADLDKTEAILDGLIDDFNLELPD